MDLFGNVFGRSKKSKTSLNTSGTPGTPTAKENGSGSENEDFAVVGQVSTNEGVYPTILTDDMLRSPPSMPASQASTWNSHSFTPAQPVTSHTRSPSMANPLDQVPFSVSGGDNAMRLNTGSTLTELGKSFQVVDRIGTFLSNSSQSVYNFQLENTVIREVQASALTNLTIN